MEFHLKSISFHLSNCWPWCQYSFPVVSWLLNYRVPLCMSCLYRYWNTNLKILQMLTITGELQLSQLFPRFLHGQVFLSRLASTCGQQTANLVSSKHMGQKLAYLQSSKQCIFTVIRTHLYTCAFLMQKWHLIELIIIHWTTGKETVRQKCAIAYFLIVYVSIGIERKGLWYDRVACYQWHSIVQMLSGKWGSCHYCCIMYIQMT